MDIRIVGRKKKDRYVVWIHPVSGDYRVPMSADNPLPERYRLRGFEVKEFHSYHEHKAWMKSKGLVNHATEDITDDGDVLKANRWGY